MTIEWRPEVTIDMPVTDLGASIEWYERVLGFALSFRVDEAGWAEVQSPAQGVTVGLNAMDSGRAGGPGSRVVLGVADIEAARAELEASGVAFDGPTDEMPAMVKLASGTRRGTR
ncbi:MAG: VOC family protein [Dehalococcoidia bacterium]|nr:VOC family protein [Dehalococcoidia bacterium]